MRMYALLLVALSGFLAACAPQLVSPYNDAIAHRVVEMYQQVASFEERMRQVAGTAAGDPRTAENARLFDDWSGSLQTMRAMSISVAPGTVDCAAVARRVDEATRRAIPSLPSGGVALPSGAPQDCQTAMIDLTLDELRAVRGQYNRVCRTLPEEGAAAPKPGAMASPEMQRRCASMWTAPAGDVLANGNLVDPLLRNLRWLLAVQEVKRASNSARGM